MTEEEAKTKWCPMLQVSVAGSVTGAVSNRDEAFIDHPQRLGRCIGSACMAWRWELDVPPKRVRKGFCGLAGKP